MEDVKGNISCFMEDVFSDISSEVLFLLNSFYYLLFDSDSVVYSMLIVKLIFGDLGFFKDDSYISLNIVRLIWWFFLV